MSKVQKVTRKFRVILSADGKGYDCIKNKLSPGNDSLCGHIILNQGIRKTRHYSTIQGMKKRRQL